MIFLALCSARRLWTCLDVPDAPTDQAKRLCATPWTSQEDDDAGCIAALRKESVTTPWIFAMGAYIAIPIFAVPVVAASRRVAAGADPGRDLLTWSARCRSTATWVDLGDAGLAQMPAASLTTCRRRTVQPPSCVSQGRRQAGRRRPAASGGAVAEFGSEVGPR
jgi:hypothetical protein